MRKTLFLSWILTAVLWSCGPVDPPETGPPLEPTPNIAEPLPKYDLTFVPGERVGVITPDSDLAALRQKYGADQVRDTAVYVGEGISQPGAIIFPDRPERLELVWTSSAKNRPEIIYIRQPDAPWTSLGSGVHIGMTLEELAARNGQPFTFSGFDWDYGGTVTDWNGGQLTGLNLRLTPTAERSSPELSGDRPISSADPVARAAGIRVDEIYVVLNRPAE